MSLIFLSHTEEDFPFTEGIARGLEESGYSTWYYERDTIAGTSYLLQITRAIESCDAVVLMASSSSITSDQVTKEIIGAFERGIPFFPILIDITPAELKEKQQEWRHALGGTAMATVSPEDLSATVSSITEGLTAMGISPGRAEAPISPVLSTPGMQATRTLTDKVLSQRASLEGERKQVTVLCAGISARDPEELHEISGFLTELIAEEVRLYEGTFASIAPDGFTALFGAPITHEDDSVRALHSALSIRKRLEDRPEGLSLKAGVNTGLLIVGAIADDLSMEYTAIGDTVNLASQLKDTAGRGTILISEDTRDLTKGYFEFEEAGELTAADGTVKTYKVTEARHAATRVEASLAKGLSHFVGREKELAHLAECLGKASEGQGQVVGVVGEAGVGKTRLILEFTRSLPPDEYTLFQGGCYHYGEAIPYLPLIELLKGYFGIEDSDDQDSIKEKLELALRLADPGGKLDAAISPLSELFSLPVEDEAYLALEPQQRREQLVSAVRQLLATESARRPLMIVLEDLHWMDRTSEDFLSSLIDGITNSRMLLILLYRPEYTSPWTSKSYYSTVRVDQLPQKTSSELISSILSEGEVSKEITELIASRASGNPLFIEELAHGLLENGSIRKEGNTYVLSGKPSELEVPDTIQGIIAARLDRLTEDLKRLMQTASVIGREFAYKLLEAITQMQEELKSSLSDLQESELIYEKSLFPELEYIFKHALTQEVAYNSLLKKRRRELHGAIGEAIEALYPDRLEEHYEVLAYHYARSDNADKAIHYLRLSGDKAAGSYANWEAIHFYKEEIQILDAQPETDEGKKKKIRVYISMLASLAFSGFPEGSEKSFQEAERLAEELGNEEILLHIYSTFSYYHTARGNTSLGVEFLLKLLDAAEKVGAIDFMAATAFLICTARFFAGDIQKTAETSLRNLQVLEEKHREEDIFLGGLNIYSALCGFWGLALGCMGEFKEAEAALSKGLENAIEVSDPFGTGWLEANRSFTSSLEGDADRTINDSQEAIKHFEESGVMTHIGYPWINLGIGYYFMGEYETARNHAENALKLHKDSGIPILMPQIYSSLALIQLALRDFENAKLSAEESLKLSQMFNSRTTATLAWTALGRAVGEADPSQIKVAEENILQGISMAEEMKLRPFAAQGRLFLGEIFEIAGRREEAIENLKVAEKMGKDLGTGYWLTRTQEALARLEQ